MTTILQKAVLPGREKAWAAGDDLLCGYVVRTADVAWADTPAKVFAAHGLGFPGSPLSADDDVVDVLRFAAPRFVRPVAAIGAELAAAGSDSQVGFVDHPPFTGNGFASVEGRPPVPLWWLDPVRVPPQSELWRVHADGHEELLAVYEHVAAGWSEGEKPSQLLPSDLFGDFVDWNGARLAADLLPNGRVVVASATQRDGLRLLESGVWGAVLDGSEVDRQFGLRMTATWRGLPFQIVRRLEVEDGQRFRLVYIGRNAFVAEQAGLEKTDAGVYEATVARDELSEVQGVELVE